MNFSLKPDSKGIYGNTPYQYLLDHKLGIARQLIISGKYQVNEVAFKIGYNNISHFIEAFKKIRCNPKENDGLKQS